MSVPDELQAPNRDRPASNREMARGLGGTMLARLGAVIELVAQPIYVALFGLTGFGLHAAIWSTVNLAEDVLNLGMNSALQRTVPRARTEDEAAAALRTAFMLGMIPTLAAALIVSLAAPSLAHVYNAPPEHQAQLVTFIRLFAWALPLWAFIEISVSALRARRAFGPEVRLRIFWEQFFRLVLAGGLFAAGFGLMSLFLAHLASLAIICLLCIRLLGRYYDLTRIAAPAPPGMARETLGAGLAVLPANVIARIFSEGPPIILNAWLSGAAGATAAALFVIARKFASIVFIVRSAFVHVLTPLASAAHAEPETLGRIFGYSNRVAVALVIPVCAAMIAGAGPILELFGPGGQGALLALQILVVGRSLEAILGNASAILLAIGDYRERLLGSFLGLAGAALLMLALLPDAGAAGAAFAVSIGIVISVGVAQRQLRRGRRLQILDSAFSSTAVRAVAIAAATAGLILAIGRLPSAAALPLVACITFAALWVSARYSLSQEDRTTFGKAGRRLRLIG